MTMNVEAKSVLPLDDTAPERGSTELPPDRPSRLPICPDSIRFFATPRSPR